MDNKSRDHQEDNGEPLDDDGAAEINYWANRFRAFGRIISDENTPRSDVVNALADRLSLILELYDCPPTMEGWRELALWLAMEFKFDKRKVIDVSTPTPNPPMQFSRNNGGEGKSQRKYPGSSGAPSKRSRNNIIVREVLKLVEDGVCTSIRDASEEISKDKALNLGLTARTIENIVSRQKHICILPPGNLWYLRYRPMIGGQMLEAAEQLTVRHKK